MREERAAVLLLTLQLFYATSNMVAVLLYSDQVNLSIYCTVHL